MHFKANAKVKFFYLNFILHYLFFSASWRSPVPGAVYRNNKIQFGCEDKMNKLKYIVPAFLVIALGACGKPDHGDGNNGVFLAALLNAPKVQGSQESLTASGGAIAAASAASPGASGYSFMLNKGQEVLMARFNATIQKQAGYLPSSIATAYTCNGGGCAGASASNSVVLGGTQTCPQGGTVTANNVTMTGTVIGASSASLSYEGPFTFNNCGTQFYQLDQFPKINFIAATLDGTLTMSGSTTFTQTGAIATGYTLTLTSNMNYSSPDWKVNGSASGAFNLTDKSNYSYSISNQQSTTNGTITTVTFNITGSGHYVISGNYGSDKINVNLPLSGTALCTYVSDSVALTFTGTCE